MTHDTNKFGPVSVPHVREPLRLPAIRGDQDAIKAQLQRLAMSSGFAKSHRRRELLDWIVARTLSGAEVTERAIALGLYGRTDDFDPLTDATIRVDVSRLRAALETYYAGEGQNDPVTISLPRRSYAPLFAILREIPPSRATEVEENTSPVVPAVRGASAGWGFAGTVLVVMVVATAAWIFSTKAHAVEGAPVVFMPGIVSEPALAPDGKHVLFSWRATADGVSGVYVRTSGSGSSETLLATCDKGCRNAAWSPDGKIIAFLRNVAPALQELVLMDTEGRNQRTLAILQSTVGGFAWLADSKSLLVGDSAVGERLILFTIAVSNGERNEWPR